MILTVQAIKSASMIKYRKIFKAVFRTSGNRISGKSATRAARAYEIPDTVGWKGIVIKRQVPFMGSSAGNPIIFNIPESAKTRFTFRDFALVHAQAAGDPVWGIRGILWQPICPPAAVVNLFDLRPDHVEMVPDTIGAISDGIGNGSAAFITI
jgi:hypothetical protein